MPAEVDPELAARLAREAQVIYSRAVAEMLETVAKRLAMGVDSPGWSEAKLAEVARLRLETMRTLATLEDDAAKAVTKALTEAYEAGGKRAAQDAGAGFVRSSPAALQQLIRETVASVSSTHSAILRSTLDRYRAVIADATTRVVIGTHTQRQATHMALDSFARAGIHGFIDSAGRRWEIETYAEMAVRTASGRAHVAGTLDRLSAQGNDFVIVSNAPEECSACRPWEGKVLSISGTNLGRQDGFTVTASVDQARGEGLLHANCRHNLSAYIPGLTTAPRHTADAQGDAERQRQRQLERRVREAKRRAAASDAYVAQIKADRGRIDPATAQMHSRALERKRRTTDELSQFVEATGRKRLRYRETV